MELIFEEFGEAILAIITALPIIGMFAGILSLASSF